MRKYSAPVWILASVFVTAFITPAYSLPSLAAILAANPSGGPALTVAIIAYLEAGTTYNTNAPAVLAAESTANAAQKIAIIKAMPVAALFFVKGVFVSANGP
jgi:hypothetical protein